MPFSGNGQLRQQGGIIWEDMAEEYIESNESSKKGQITQPAEAAPEAVNLMIDMVDDDLQKVAKELLESGSHPRVETSRGAMDTPRMNAGTAAGKGSPEPRLIKHLLDHVSKRKVQDAMKAAQGLAGSRPPQMARPGAEQSCKQTGAAQDTGSQGTSARADKTDNIDREALRKMADQAITGRHLRITQELNLRQLQAPTPEKHLDKYRQATPCGKAWDTMACWDTLDGTGGGRVRLCKECKLQVYNLNDMSQAEAEDLVFQRENRRLKVEFFRRKDGTFMTSNCPVGIKRQRNRMLAGVGLILIFCLFMAMALLAPGPEKKTITRAAKLLTPATTKATLGKQGKESSSLESKSLSSNNKHVVFKLSPPPAPGALPPAPNSRGPYPAAHNPLEKRVAPIKEIPKLPYLPDYTGSGVKIFDVVCHPFLRDGKQCYEQRMVFKADTASVLSWYRSALTQTGWSIQQQQSNSSMLIAHRPDGSSAFLAIRPTARKGYRSLATLRYVLYSASARK